MTREDKRMEDVKVRSGETTKDLNTKRWSKE